LKATTYKQDNKKQFSEKFSKLQLDPDFGSPGFGKIRFWQPICAAPAVPMAYIMLNCSVYGNPGFSKTPNLANDFYARIA
jgi:hypothetical protein